MIVYRLRVDSSRYLDLDHIARATGQEEWCTSGWTVAVGQIGSVNA